MKAGLKEKVKSVPKGLARRGLDSGAERLRTQLRDAAQEGRSDQQGGDSIEDAAAGGLRQTERGVEGLLKRKHADRATPKERTADAPEGRGGGPRLPTDQVGEPAPKEPPAPGKGGGEGPRTRPGRTTRQSAAPDNSERPIIKTKETFIQGQTATLMSQAGAGHTQGGSEFVRERGRRTAEATPSRYSGGKPLEPANGDMRAGRQARPLSKDAQGGWRHHPETVRKGDSPRLSGTGSRPSGGVVRPKARVVEQPGRQTAKTVGRTSTRTADAVGRGTRRVAQTGQRAARTRQAAKTAQTTAKKTAQATGRAIRAIAAAMRGLATAILAGGWVVLAIVLVICLVGMLLASPFGIFFSGEDSGTGYTMPEAVLQLNGEFTDRIEQIKAANPHDTLDLDNAGSAAMVSNWADVLAVYAVRTSTDPIAPEEVATLTDAKLSILREIFWDMNVISHWLEVIPGDEEEGESDTTVLHITVTIKNHLQMAEEYGFTDEQRALLAELMEPENQELFLRLTGSYRDITLSPVEVRAILAQLPDDLSEERRQVVLTAYQLLGKVNYFWGGKSLVLGWDARWGTPMEVWAEGSSTTGTLRPFGLDCSGYVDWVFYNITGGEYVIGHGGGASAQHSYCADITWDEAQPGDLVFYPGDSHVGIICGFDGSGDPLVIHCASGQNNVVVTGMAGFTAVAKPWWYMG